MEQDVNQDVRPLIHLGTFRSIHWLKVILAVVALFIYGCTAFFLGHKLPASVNNFQYLVQNSITPPCQTDPVCITSISPDTTQVGEVITLSGIAFEPTDNYIYLTGSSTTVGNYTYSVKAYTGSLPSLTSTRIEFTIPNNLTSGGGADPYNNLCQYFSSSCSSVHNMMLGTYPVIPGNYKIQVINKHGLSNSVSLTIK